MEEGNTEPSNTLTPEVTENDATNLRKSGSKSVLKSKGSKLNLTGSKTNLSKSASPSKANLSGSKSNISKSRTSLAKTEVSASKTELAVENGAENVTATNEQPQQEQQTEAQQGETSSEQQPTQENVAPAETNVVENEDIGDISELVNQEDLADILSENGGDDQLGDNVVARLIMSPEPAATNQVDEHHRKHHFEFVHADYEKDPEGTQTIELVTPLNRVTSSDVLIQQAIPELRPTTPSVSRPNSVDKGKKGGVDASSTGTQVKTRPTTAKVAAVVEPEPVVEEQIDREQLVVDIKALLEKKEKLKNKNLNLQNKLGEYFKKRKTDDNRDTDKNAADHEQRYATSLNIVKELKREYSSAQNNHLKVVEDHKQKLEEKHKEVSEKTEEFRKYKRTVASNAENSRTGKGIPAKVLDQIEATESRKEQEVNAVRLEYIKLRNKLKRNEQLLRQKEELADGLHLIDFEQLKIENQTYNEKIEERNEELTKLRKKINNVVQILTHVKEKLQFVQTDNVTLHKTLGGLDEEVAKERDSLPLSKQERDVLRTTTMSIKQNNALLGNVPLLRDFEGKMDDCDSLEKRIEEYRKYHADISAEIFGLKREIKKAQAVGFGVF